MATGLKALQEFLQQRCDVKLAAAAPGGAKSRFYVLDMKDCLLFMAETHIEDMRKTVDQSDEIMAAARTSGDYSEIIMSYNWDAPEPGMDTLRIPVKLVDSLDDKRAMQLLRNLEGIAKDIDEGRSRREAVQQLFGDTATVKTSANLDGERTYAITGKASAQDRRNYAERYAEHVATNVLFDLPKVLNARLETILPKESRGRYFAEGRDITSRKLRYGADADIELVLTDEGGAVYASLAKTDAKAANEVGKLFKQAMTDPFGLSLKYAMGKHAVIKLPAKPKKK